MLFWVTKALSQTSANIAAAVGQPAIPTVIITGLVLVFAILLILIAVILIQGRIFGAMDKRKHSDAGQPDAPKPSAPSQAAAPAPVVQKGISPEVVAAISAAVHAASGGTAVLRSVAAGAKASAQSRRGAWGLAGVMQGTEPF